MQFRFLPREIPIRRIIEKKKSNFHYFLFWPAEIGGGGEKGRENEWANGLLN